MSESKFTICGRLVTHLPDPRFTMLFRSAADGGWHGEMVGAPPAWPAGCSAQECAALVARLAREAGDYFAANLRRDWLQEAVIVRASELGLTAYALSARTGGAISVNHIHAYLKREKSMGSHKLQHLLRALSLELVISKDPNA